MTTHRLLQTAQYIALYLLIAFIIGACQKESFTTNSITTGPNPPVSNPGSGLPPIVHWVKSNDMPLANPVATGREGSYGFTINSKGYICAGLYTISDGTLLNAIDNWEFDPSTNAWTQKADFPSWYTYGGASFVIGNNAYVVASGNQENWQYSQATNTWSHKADFPKWRQYATALSIGGAGYVGGGDNGTGPGSNNFGKDWYMYLPLFDTWSRIADFPGKSRQRACGFVNGNKGYVCLGDSSDYSVSEYFHDCWQYNAATNAWTKKAEFPGKGRSLAVSLSVNGTGIVTTGLTDFKELAGTAAVLKDTWEYAPSSDTWNQFPDFYGGARSQAVGFAIGNTIYVGGGDTWPAGSNQFGDGKKDLWIMAL